jgi:uncharacterized protein
VRTDPTFLGLVRRVTGARVFVEVSSDIPSASPIIEGHLYRLGQVGSFVRLPLGFMNVFGIVSMVGASELVTTREQEPEFELPAGQRWMEIQLVGEAYGKGTFHRGVSIFPTLDDEVHIVTEADLSVVYSRIGSTPIKIGNHASSEGLPALINIEKIVTRHAAIVGSTGSGKSNTVACILKALSNGDYPGAKVVVIDPHGEYGSAFGERSRVFKIGDPSCPLIIPYWVMSFDELAWFFIDRRTGTESLQDSAFREKIYEMRKASAPTLKAGAVQGTEVTADSPIPFDIRELWYGFDFQERATFKTNACQQGDEELIQQGDAKALTSATFKPVALGAAAPFRNKAAIGIQPQMNRLLGRLKDKRFEFMCKPGTYDGISGDLDGLVNDWLNDPAPITVFDLGGVPFEVVDLVAGMLTRIIFEIGFWGRDLPGVGRQAPVLIVFEEAHSYLPRGEGRFIQGFARKAVQRIFKEGRKYGIGAVVVSQRPSELDETVLSQCGTFFSLRLSNSEDQGRVRSVVPDALSGLIDLLPALRTGEAVVLGEAVPLPSRIRLPLEDPRPRSDDPPVAENWRKQRTAAPDYAKAATGWRIQEQAVPDEEPATGGKSDG